MNPTKILGAIVILVTLLPYVEAADAQSYAVGYSAPIKCKSKESESFWPAGFCSCSCTSSKEGKEEETWDMIQEDRALQPEEQCNRLERQTETTTVRCGVRSRIDGVPACDGYDKNTGYALAALALKTPLCDRGCEPIHQAIITEKRWLDRFFDILGTPGYTVTLKVACKPIAKIQPMMTPTIAPTSAPE